MHQFTWRRVLIACAIVLFGLLVAIAIPYTRLARRVDHQLAAGPFVRTYSFYSASEVLSRGDQSSPEDIVPTLKRLGFHETGSALSPGSYLVKKDSLVLRPASPGGHAISFGFVKGVVDSIRDVDSGSKIDEYPIPPQLIANVSDSGREKRVFVHFAELPPVLVNAIVSAEDKRFFTHAGFDPLRIAKAAYVDFKDQRKEQGASTLTMQLARNLWLDPDKRWKRKATELLITLHLERKLTKQQIFEYYCNQVYLGGRSTFSINGFGQAAHEFFNKSVNRLSLPEAALLAGLIQRPSFFNPVRYPDRAFDRRNIVLRLMHDNRYINDAQFAEAVASPVKLSPGITELSDTQYYLDLAAEETQKHLEDREWHGVADVYTTIDLRLQRAAENAIRDGMKKLDLEIKRRRKGVHEDVPPQVALIALDPRTGQVKALCGGRSYSVSQLNRILAKRPPGSVFKPFVYATALSTAVNPSPKVFTQSSTVTDAPTVFRYANQTYSPDNFEHQFYGQVTFRLALAKSLNVATVRVGEMVGFDAVVALAKRAGMNEDIQPTPAVALGAYGVTPLEIAGAYTIFANGGVRERPVLIDSVRQGDGTGIYEREASPRRVLDPRIAFLMVDMLQEVMRSGTAAGVRSMGFKQPAAGKTGTSHDGWFAGFTSGLLCVVWVGYDNYHELNVEGAHSALPIWTQFMLEASHSRKFREAKPFTVPPGVTRATVDPGTGGLANEFCPAVVTAYFIDGTQPTSSCALHDGITEPVTVLENVAGEQIRPY